MPRMEGVTSTPQPAPYTILRIKRKRNEEPLDALVVEDKVRRKKSKGAVGVFQYAQTVENNAWNDAKSQKEIQDAISKLSTMHAAIAEEKAKQKTRQHSPLAARHGSPHTARRYTIIEVDQNMSPTKQTPGSLPQSGSVKEDEQMPSVPDFKMYDAVPSVPDIKPVEEDPEMVKFQSMLSDYLSINDIQLSPLSQSPSVIRTDASSNDSIPKPPTAEDEYVWDVFYHMPTSLTEWNDLANVGMLSTFPASLFDEDYEDDSESELEDEADEDSNEEDFYRNDYPDEESDSDEFHEHSEHDEVFATNDDDDF
ncbi:hypothetical protein DFP72DRAFT_1168320 [Ephemerocybe angulata]|uniref:Probable RNA polymerase II nuclear localization protein SLC7A6OS n=1 Tax=Ephemerocybe angulata TaxID=980116 RepID=A0A8H6I275_9AGAR|nr:hypothetical protein DFP72DRAFT_1168320 [Tulosesus angulatus]